MTARLGLGRLIRFCRELGMLLQSGVALSRALAVMAEQSRWGHARLCRRLAKRIEGGGSFADVLDAEGRGFPRFQIELTRAGESSGQFALVWETLADYYESLRHVWRQFWGALAYPIGEFWAGVFVLAFLGYVTDQSPLGMTWREILVGGTVVFFAPILVCFLIMRFVAGRRIVQHVLARLPIWRFILRQLALGRFLWAMRMALEAALPVTQCVAMGAKAGDHPRIQRDAPAVTADLEGGLPLGEALARMRDLPQDVLAMISVAEESGALPVTLERLAREYMERCQTLFLVAGHVTAWLVWLILAMACISLIF